MSSTAIIFKSDGKPYLIEDLPVEPKFSIHVGADHLPYIDYQKSYQQAIDNAILIQNGEAIEELMYKHSKSLAYPVYSHPYLVDFSEYEVNVEGANSCKYSKCDCATYTECFDKRVYITKKENNAHSYTEGSDMLKNMPSGRSSGWLEKAKLRQDNDSVKEESQDKMWTEIYEATSLSYSEVQVLKHRFTLTRKK